MKCLTRKFPLYVAVPPINGYNMESGAIQSLALGLLEPLRWDFSRDWSSTTL
jgi:hypothetical protein